jgi:hypothetical protein
MANKTSMIIFIRNLRVNFRPYGPGRAFMASSLRRIIQVSCQVYMLGSYLIEGLYD